MRKQTCFGIAAGALLLSFPAVAAPSYSIASLGVLPGGWHVSDVSGINDAGQVVGEIYTSEGTHAFPWDPVNGMRTLGTLAGGLGSSSTRGIDNAGQVVGQTSTSTGSAGDNHHAYLWDAVAGMRDLGTLPASQRRDSDAFGINDAGQVVGVSDTSTGYNHAFIWDEVTGMRDLGVLLGGSDRSLAFDINDASQMVGISYSSWDDTQAFLWDPVNGMQDLGDLPGHVISFSSSINDVGQVVGGSNTPTSGHAFLWDAVHGMRDLNDLIDRAAGWILEFAEDINSGGQIVGYGTGPNGYPEAFLLTPSETTPLPEPGTFVLLGTGLMGLAWMRWRMNGRSGR